MASPGGEYGEQAQQQQTDANFSGSSSSSRSRDCEAMEPTSLSMGLLQKITNNFSEELGQGGYGKVYKGVCDGGQEIAVKLLYSNMQTVDDAQFKREFKNLMVLKHPNIVRLVGYCYETQHQHFRELQGGFDFFESTHKALCFEYMPMGSLQKHLSDEFTGLNWETRYKIIKGACEGLKYLHEGLKPPICHLDLKPDNILLDKNMDPKLADFGLSKFYGKEQTWITQSPITGTLGYMPPEYLFQKVVSKKFDIFSLGAVMIKIIAGPSDHDTSSAKMKPEFLDQVQRNWRKSLQTTLTSPEPLEAQCQQVKTCTEIALSCIETDRHKRPSIGDIIHELNKTELFLKADTYYEQEPSPPPASTSNVVQPVATTPPSTPSPPPSPTPSYIGSSTPRRRPPPPPPSGGFTGFFRTIFQGKPKIKGHSRSFTYRELESATSSFADTRKLAQGAFGVVYKGEIIMQGKEVSVAIKKITYTMSDEEKVSFYKEIEIMSPLNHRNIIRLVGWCDERKNLLLVYELVDDRNLKDRLYGRGASVYLSSGLYLDWRQRYNILLGIASGLEYLHDKCGKPILHMDIKPGNVMLDRDFQAKLCDFGLVTQLIHAITSRSTDNFIGTQGYMDPAYQNDRRVTRASDVYSFGMLLLEVVCGVAPILIGNPPKNSLIERVRQCAERNAILDAADKRLRGESHEEIKGAMLIGLCCVETRRGDRPTIHIVLARLLGLVAQSTTDSR